MAQKYAFIKKSAIFTQFFLDLVKMATSLVSTLNWVKIVDFLIIAFFSWAMCQFWVHMLYIEWPTNSHVLQKILICHKGNP